MSESFFSKLKGMVIQDDATSSVLPTPTVSPVVASQAVQVQPTIIQVDPAAPSVLDIASLEQIIDNNIKNGVDFIPFTKFMEISSSMESVLKDESTRFKAAAATTKVATADLITSVESYKQVLANEEMNFQNTFVKNAEIAINDINTETTDIEKQILELTGKLGELSDRKNSLARESIDAQGELAKAKIDFVGVSSTLEKRYAAIVQKLQQYLGA